MQNIPNAEKFPGFRGCFVAPKGTKLIVADYSQQEPRITADKANDSILLDFYENGDGDTHSLVASKMFSVIEGKEVKITKGDPRRQIGKVLNLKLDYGGSAYTVKHDLKTTEEEAQKFIDALKSAFPQKETYFKACKKQALKEGYVLIDPITNRRSWLDRHDRLQEVTKELDILKKSKSPIPKEMWSDFFTIRGQIERSAMNFPIQGTAASMTKLAAWLFYEAVQKLNLLDKIKIVNMVHDELVLEVIDEYVIQASRMIEDAMVKAGALFCTKVKMVVDPVVTEYWDH